MTAPLGGDRKGDWAGMLLVGYGGDADDQDRACVPVSQGCRASVIAGWGAMPVCCGWYRRGRAWQGHPFAGVRFLPIHHPYSGASFFGSVPWPNFLRELCPIILLSVRPISSLDWRRHPSGHSRIGRLISNIAQASRREPEHGLLPESNYRAGRFFQGVLVKIDCPI